MNIITEIRNQLYELKRASPNAQDWHVAYVSIDAWRRFIQDNRDAVGWPMHPDRKKSDGKVGGVPVFFVAHPNAPDVVVVRRPDR